MKKNELPPYEQQLIIAHILKKSREYVLTHPEVKLTEAERLKFQKMITRRVNHEPMAYILGHKEFYGLDFKVTKDTLIPRPETEMLVKLAGQKAKNDKSDIIDLGTGSGNIIISIAKNFRNISQNKIKFYGIDISSKALTVAKRNSKIHKADNPPAGGIKFIKSDLLNYFLDHPTTLNNNLILIANLPYLSEKIYSATMPDVKNFEPASALVSGKHGLDHYEKLFSQIKKLKEKRYALCITCYAEFSPEQKPKISSLIKKYFPKAKPEFKKDLAGKWRVCMLKI